MFLSKNELRYIILFLLGVFGLFMTSCGGLQRQTQLFRDERYEKIYKEGRKQKFAIIRRFPPVDTVASYRYKLQQGDELRIRFLNLPPELAQGTFEIKADEKYIVNFEGYVTAPLIGKVFVLGKTTEDVNRILSKEFSAYFPNPSIDIAVSNLKVFIYGEGKQGVITLPTERTHLLEALAIAGGVPNTAKRHKVKIIRGDLKNPQIIWVDLNYIEALSDPDMYMRSGDVIFLESRNLALIAREVTPYATFVNIISLLATTYLIVRSIKN